MDSPDKSDPLRPSGSKPEEPETSQMAAVPPDPQVVWPEDPFEADGHAAETDPDAVTPPVPEPVDPPWTHQFGKQPARPGYSHPAPAHDPHTAPFPTQHASSERSPSEPSVGKTQPPASRGAEPPTTQPPAAPTGDAMKTAPPVAHAGDMEDTKPPAPSTEALKTAPPVAHDDDTLGTRPPAPSMEAFKTAPPLAKTAPTLPAAAPAADEEGVVSETTPSVPAANEEEPATLAAEETASEPLPFEAEPRAQDPDSEPDLPVIASQAAEPIAAASAPPPVDAPQPASSVEPAPPPIAEPAPAPIAASSPAAPEAAKPVIPAWAPKLPVGPEENATGTRWPGSNLPSWAPVAGGPSTGAPPERVRITSSPGPSPSPPSAPVPPPAPGAQAAKPAPPASASASPATAGTPGTKSSASWEIVQQKVDAAPAFTGPTAEDKSYAEWFAWAKRSGAPASACHAAAQGAFRALSTGQDMNIAVQWATLAMASPPGLVGTSRQLYCAWYSLGNIDLKLPTAQAHAFASGAVQALEGGADSMVAHQMGLAAAGITPR
jgi:hypothetical protein